MEYDGIKYKGMYSHICLALAQKQAHANTSCVTLCEIALFEYLCIVIKFVIGNGVIRPWPHWKLFPVLFLKTCPPMYSLGCGHTGANQPLNQA